MGEITCRMDAGDAGVLAVVGLDRAAGGRGKRGKPQCLVQVRGRLCGRVREQDIDNRVAAVSSLTAAPWLSRETISAIRPSMTGTFRPARSARIPGAIAWPLANTVSPSAQSWKSLTWFIDCGPDQRRPLLVRSLEAVAVGAGDHRCAPVLGKAWNIRHRVDNAIAQDQAAGAEGFTVAGDDGEIVEGAGDAVGAVIENPDRHVARELMSRRHQVR